MRLKWVLLPPTWCRWSPQSPATAREFRCVIQQATFQTEHWANRRKTRKRKFFEQIITQNETEFTCGSASLTLSCCSRDKLLSLKGKSRVRSKETWASAGGLCNLNPFCNHKVKMIEKKKPNSDHCFFFQFLILENEIFIAGQLVPATVQEGEFLRSGQQCHAAVEMFLDCAVLVFGQLVDHGADFVAGRNLQSTASQRFDQLEWSHRPVRQILNVYTDRRSDATQQHLVFLLAISTPKLMLGE